ncbi:uncharacterized protein LOC135195893 [Macrobrachium nipponense]|uniref:uncharacterized protein LOC135195893 n=1 Tax=Macrobrachium nipponense TaxID=159736 RepID=UPI0030C7F6B7
MKAAEPEPEPEPLDTAPVEDDKWLAGIDLGELTWLKEEDQEPSSPSHESEPLHKTLLCCLPPPWIALLQAPAQGTQEAPDEVLLRVTRGAHEPTEVLHRQVVVPCNLTLALLLMAHEGLGGHFGVKCTTQQIQRQFFWPGLPKSVKAYIASCLPCQVAGNPNQVVPRAPLQPIPSASIPFHDILVDYARSETTGYSPFELLFAHSTHGPLDILYEAWENPTKASWLEELLDIQAKITGCMGCCQSFRDSGAE